MKEIILKESKIINGKIYPKGTVFSVVKEASEKTMVLENSIYLGEGEILSKGSLIEKINTADKKNNLKEASSDYDSISWYLESIGRIEMFGHYIGGTLNNKDPKYALSYLKELRKQLIKEMDYVKRGM